MDVMSTRQILVKKNYDERHYRHENIVTIMQTNLFMTILLNF
jgi:hypothetical protein